MEASHEPRNVMDSQDVLQVASEFLNQCQRGPKADENSEPVISSQPGRVSVGGGRGRRVTAGRSKGKGKDKKPSRNPRPDCAGETQASVRSENEASPSRAAGTIPDINKTDVDESDNDPGSGLGGYQQQSFCMTPVSRTPTTSRIFELYNEQHIQGRLIVEQSFGRLKRRWRSLDVGICSNVSLAPYLVHAACCLQKFLLAVGDSFEPDEPSSADPSDARGTAEADQAAASSSTYAAVVRKELATYLCLSR
ncbi:hypothetical protein R1sor_014816 [Riccia sorocarpa]|uniref:DDE Tnp4 domain-containing protein n=1 Tax=Riccia sorocarpa TaxID=122646 RepID=A0ABD3HD39_9MARC